MILFYMYRRLLAKHLKTLLSGYPAVALVGPRQTGKTTLARSFEGHYFDLEQEADRVRLNIQWAELLSSKKLVILDEAQAWPAAFPMLRGAIDAARKRTGRFLLLGSVAPALMREVGESLAGRLALTELTPFILPELTKAPMSTLWFFGGYPDGGILKKKNYPVWQQNYLQLLAQRDLPTWGLPALPATTLRFFRMLAASHGQIWNASQIGASMGLSYHTVNSYLDYLQNAFLIRVLPPFHANLRKRLVKHPKVYWRDSGLLHSLLNVPKYTDLLSQPWVGASWEGWVIEQILGTLSAQGRSFQPYYFRSADGLEADLVLELEGRRWVIEIKLSSSPDSASLERLNRIGDLIHATDRALISRTREKIASGAMTSSNLEDFLKLFK